ncbi:hypothetical protein PM8797T_16343 [Gimesia maris DSM 8797]|nr:hypothetical protein PM8797T_16343 [Gimesia maris DSM 8797]
MNQFDTYEFLLSDPYGLTRIGLPALPWIHTFGKMKDLII